jgi:hypothetical protein
MRRTKPFKREYRKLMAKAGRKRKQNVGRFPSGGIKPEDARETVIAARTRLYGMDRDTAVRQEAGSAIGRALQAGEISQQQFEAANEWEARRREYSLALGSRKQRSASEFGGPSGFDGREGDDPDYITHCERAKARYAEVRRGAMEADPFGLMALEVWAFEDRTDFNLLGSLRVACNAIARVIKNAK